MTVSKTATGRIWAAGGRPFRMPVAGVQPGRGEALCVFQAYGTQASQIGDLAQKVGGVKALSDALKMNRGTLQHIVDGHRPVPLRLWQSLTGVDQMTAALAGLERARRQRNKQRASMTNQ